MAKSVGRKSIIHEHIHARAREHTHMYLKYTDTYASVSLP